MKKIVLLCLTVSSVVWFSGCAGAMQTAIKKRDLIIETKMSETIFIDPVSPKEKIVYISYVSLVLKL